MLEFVLFCIPTLIYVLVVARKPEQTIGSAFAQAGGSRGTRSGYLLALALLPSLLLTGWLAMVLIPREVLELPGVMIAQVTSAAAVVGVVLRAVGEEVFFRGLLGGVLIRRLGFALGNLLQAALFLLPHLPLLLIDLRTWPILPVQFATGWLLGWLRNRSASFVPGAIVHAVANLAAGLIVPL